jgi:AcrR family transcriptional regulator
MARTKGSRTEGYEERREALLRAFQRRLIQPDAEPPSFSELAAAAEVSIPTVRHYFGKREDVILALLEHLGREGAEHLAHVSVQSLPFAASMAELAGYIAAGFRFGLSELHAMGLRSGLRDSRLGPAYLATLLEPTLAAVESRLKAHQKAGEMKLVEARYAALSLVSPILLTALHQRELGGSTTRLIDEQAFLDAHVGMFVQAFADQQDTELH